VFVRQPARDELSKVIQRLAPAITGKALDIGCQYPRYKNLFPFSTYTTLDINPGADILGRIEAIPSDDASYNSIVCTQVLGDVFDLRKAFSEMHRVLVPNGYALISEAHITPLHDEPNDFWRFTPHSLRALAEQAGFSVRHLVPLGKATDAERQLKLRRVIATRHNIVAAILSRLYHFFPSRIRYADAPLGYVMLIQKS
jgi:SAM-dependent methyltransferase